MGEICGKLFATLGCESLYLSPPGGRLTELCVHRLFFLNLLPDTLLFSRFVLHRCIGASSVGGIYLCRDVLKQEQLVAIKIISSQIVDADKHGSNLLRELNFSKGIDHPNVLKGQEFFRDEDFTAYTMEYLAGGSLADCLEKSQRFNFPTCIRMLLQLCDGTDAIHSTGVVHRDLKPENVLVGPDSLVKITDFGISSSLESPSDVGRNNITGSLNYLSPEYVTSGEFDTRSDIYSLGIMAYELLTGKLPFQGKTLLDSLRLRVVFDPLAPHQLVNGIPRPLSYAVMKALERSPSQRFQSAIEFRDALNFIRLPLGVPPWALGNEC